MSVQTPTYDVFLSYSLTEGPIAELVECALTQAGLRVFNHSKLERGRHIEDALRLALAESGAVVAIVDPQRGPASAVAVELGAAMAWHKPIYLVHADIGVIRLPSYLQEFPTYPISRADDVVRSVKQGLNPLSEEQFRKRQTQRLSDDIVEFAIIRKDSDELIGTVNLRLGPFNTHKLGIMIGDQKHRRKGFGTEAVKILMRIAFLEKNVHKLQIGTREWNVPAQKHAEALGFKLAVRTRKYVQKDGQWYDRMDYDMLREEYLERYGSD